MTALVRVTDAGAVIDEAATRVAGAMRARLDGPFRLAISGGPGIEGVLARLAAMALDWQEVEVLFTDESAAPPSEPESHYWMARKLLFEPAGLKPDQIHRMRAEATDLESAALDYEGHLRLPIDLAVLERRPDGSLAGLPPGAPAATDRRVVPVSGASRFPPRGLTVTGRVLAEAREVLVLASGAAADARVIEADVRAGWTWITDHPGDGRPASARPGA